MGLPHHQQLPSDSSIMMKVKDTDGKIVEGVLRTPSGSLIVDREVEYEKYKTQKAILVRQQTQIADLKTELEELKNLVRTLASTPINKNSA